MKHEISLKYHIASIMSNYKTREYYKISQKKFQTFSIFQKAIGPFFVKLFL